MLALEARIMFDGALAVDVVDVVLDHSTDNVEADKEVESKVAPDLKRVLFVDSDILTSINFDHGIDGQSEIYTLDPNVDGVEQISGYLSGKQGIDSIHIISHGSEGQVNIGNTVLNTESLSSYREQLVEIGSVLSVDGDILLYGCNVAEATGRDFVASLAKVTGADVAASVDLTGDIDAGGDWSLEVASGSIEDDTTLFSEYSGFSGLLTTPSVSDGGRTGYFKDADAVVVAPAMNITNGPHYGGGGSLTVAVTSVDTSETLSLTKVGTALTGSNVVSVVGSTLYLGSGSGANVVGSIDPTNNGESGNNLQINFLSDSFTNASFETGDLTGWTADTNTQIDIGTTSIAGVATPSDSSDPANSGGDSDVPTRKGTWTADIKTNAKSHGDYSLQLKSASMTSANGYDVIHGPSVYSDIFEGENGQTISFDWRALAGSDAYDVFGYIVNTDTNATSEILNETGADDDGNTNWATANVTIPSTGNYRFVFISGTYDFTGGKALGASLYIDNIQVFNAVNDSVVSQVAKLITYETTDTTLTEADRAARTLTFTATDADGNSANNTAIIFEDFPVEIVNPQQVAVTNTVGEVNVPASEIKINRDGLQTFVRDKGAAGSPSSPLAFGSGVFGVTDVQTNEATPIVRNDNLQSQSSPSIVPTFNTAVIPQANSSGLNDGGLSVLNGIKDPEISPLGIISFSIPIDAFAKSNNDTMVSLKASRSGGEALPSWLKFDAVEGKFQGEVPEDFEGSIEVLVTATDQNGNEVTTSFVIGKDTAAPTESSEQTKLLPSNVREQILALQKQAFSRPGFSQQILMSRVSDESLSQKEMDRALQLIRLTS
jgi:hypothetical protein